MFEGESRLIEEASQTPPRAAPGAITASPAAKFLIGLLAGVAAVLLPRVLALVPQSDGAQIVFFPTPYFLLAGGVGLFIGLVMLVFEYGVPAKPRDTFMAALGIPAIISGALGAASGADSAAKQAAETAELRQAVSREQGVVLNGGELGAIQPLTSAAPARPAARSSSLWIPFIGTAHAQGALAAQTQRAEPIRFGIHVEQPKYLVSLKRAETADEAVREEQKLRAQLPSARAVKADKGFYVILNDAPAGETEALLAAARARKLLGDKVQPVLFEVRQ